MHSLNNIRNIGIIAHVDAGKTTSVERMLFFSGKSHTIGEVHDGKSKTDYEEIEKKRGITIKSTLISFNWNEKKIQIIESGGHHEVQLSAVTACRVMEGAVIILCAVAGVEVQSESTWRETNKNGVATLAYVNKMDRQGADFGAVVHDIRNKFGKTTVALHLPVGAGDSFEGIIDLVSNKYAHYENIENFKTPGIKTLQCKLVWKEIPEHLKVEASKARELMLEALSLEDDSIAEKYLSGISVGKQELVNSIRKLVQARKIIPVLCGSSFKDKGVELLLDGIVDYLPSPADVGQVTGINPDNSQAIIRKIEASEPFSGYVFKIIVDNQGALNFIRVYSGSIKAGDTIYNPRTRQKERIGRMFEIQANDRKEIKEARAGDLVAITGTKGLIISDTICDINTPIIYPAMTFSKPVISVAIEPRKESDRDKLSTGLSKLALQDPTFSRRTDPDTKQTILEGLGELHLEIIIEKLKLEHNVEVNSYPPQVAYKQTISGGVIDVEGRHVKQSGGHGAFGICNVRFEHDETAEPLNFVNDVIGGSVPREYIQSVEKGIRNALDGGGILGVPFVNIKASLYDGKSHSVDSSDLAFQLAGIDAFRNCIDACKLILLEPRMKFEVVVPDEFTGPVIGSLVSKRALVESQDFQHGVKIIKGVVPISEMFQYTTNLRSMTSGRGSISLEPFDFAPCPMAVQNKIYEDAKKRQDKKK